jgi:hypothetical protein
MRAQWQQPNLVFDAGRAACVVQGEGERGLRQVPIEFGGATHNVMASGATGVVNGANRARGSRVARPRVAVS